MTRFLLSTIWQTILNFFLISFSAAVNAETREEVAIKKIGNAFDNRIDAKRTLREIKLLRHMDHENVFLINLYTRTLIYLYCFQSIRTILPTWLMKPSWLDFPHWISILKSWLIFSLQKSRLLTNLLFSPMQVMSIKDIIRPPQKENFNDVYIVSELMDTDLHQIIRSNQPLNDDHCRVSILTIYFRI